MEYYQFKFEEVAAETIEQLIALLDGIGFTGFEEEEGVLKAFINRSQFDENQFDLVIQPLSVKYSQSTIQEENWNAKWESGFEPVTVFHPVSGERFLHLRASFHEPDPAATHQIVITPKMSFGTGHHATTYLMAEQMSQLDIKGKSVFDFGTGTGVLAILAEKLGASKVIAVDNDEWSIRNAEENIAANHCEKIILKQVDHFPVVEKLPVILANINLNVIVNNLPAIKQASEKGAKILLSGIMNKDEEALEAALKQQNILVQQVFQKNEWSAILAISY